MALMNVQQSQIVDPLLTEIILGFTPSDMVWIKLFPRVSVGTAIGKYAKFGDEIYTETETERQPGEDKAEVSLAVGSGSYNCQTHDLEGKLPKEHYDNALAVNSGYGAAVEQEAARLAYAKILRRQEIKAATLATNASNYASDHKITLAGSSQWTHADANPIQQFNVAKDVIQLATDQWPNTLVLPYSGFNALLDHPTIVERYKHVKTPEQVKGQSLDQQAAILGAVLGVKNVHVAQAPVKNPQTSVRTRIGGDNAVLAYVPENGFVFVPAYGYTFGMPGFPVIYEAEYRKKNNSYFYPAADYYDLQLTNASAGYLFSDVTA